MNGAAKFTIGLVAGFAIPVAARWLGVGVALGAARIARRALAQNRLVQNKIVHDRLTEP